MKKLAEVNTDVVVDNRRRLNWHQRGEEILNRGS